MTQTPCQQCQREISTDFEFCPYCGAVSRCRKCRVELASDYKFCPNCGTNVDAFDIVGVSSQNPQEPAPPAPAPQEPVLHAPTPQEPAPPAPAPQEPTGDIGIGTAELPVMSFSNAVKLGFQKYFDFSGRATRAEFWWWMFFGLLAYVGWSIVNAFTGPALYLITIVLSLGLMIPTLALWVRRLHDINRTGWWMLMALGAGFIIPMIVLIWWVMKRGYGSLNKYGPAPRQTASKRLLGVGVLWWIVGLVLLSSVVSLVGATEEEIVAGLLGEASPQQSGTGSDNNASKAKSPPTAVPTTVPIIFSDEQASSFLLVPNNFPNNWTAKKNNMVLDASNDYLTDFDVKMIKITLETHDTEAAAQAAFSTKKTEAQTTIDSRGISGDKLEDVKKYPLFVWNASSQANIAGVEKWTVIGVYGNITMKVYHEGSMGAPKKRFAVDIAKKQIDKIMGN